MSTNQNLSLSTLLKQVGLSPQTFYRRMRQGWTLEDALNTPSGRRSKYLPKVKPEMDIELAKELYDEIGKRVQEENDPKRVNVYNVVLTALYAAVYE